MARSETSQEDLAEQAANWLVRIDSGQADLQEFENWRNADPRHAATFAQIAIAWQNVADLRTAGIELGADTREDAQEEEEPEEKSSHFVTRRRALTGLAASVVLAAVGTGALLHHRKVYAETGIGERRTIQLPGGSRALLNTDTRIGWDMGETLSVWLERGEAALFVGSGTSRPVFAHAAMIKAQLGQGSFNLELIEAGPVLIAMAGAARIAQDGRKITLLTAGHAMREINGVLTEVALTQAQIARASAWQRGEIIFDGMPLIEAIAEFNRYLPNPIELSDPSIGGVRLGGRYNIDDPNGFLKALHAGFGIDSRHVDGRTYLYRPTPEA